jgi:hypothetical protein
MENENENENENLIEDDLTKEFCNILQLLVDKDLAVFYQVLMFDDEAKQIQTLRKYRNHIKFYSNLYNAYTARTLVLDPITHIRNEIIVRFTKL